MSLTNNDTLRRLRYALDLKDSALEQCFVLGQLPLTQERISDLLRKDTDADFLECSDHALAAFLDGLISLRRGPRPSKAGDSAPAVANAGNRQPLGLSNNDVLKKLRIALELQEQDIIQIMARAGVVVSASEMGALFRQPGHRNYKVCGDQFLRQFLTGLAGYRQW
jgi:uncharacterized protein YehS (DUF1456 family)